MKNFDVFVGVDWSGSKALTTKSIAVSIARQGDGAPQLLSDLRSRSAVYDFIMTLAQKGGRVLVGIDANFGYAATTLQKQLGHGASAFDLWARVEVVNQHNPNFFAGGFWTHPNYAPYFWEEGKKLQGFEMPQRLTEKLCADNGYGRPESPFKLIGARQVGKGGLAAQRLSHHLKNALDTRLAVWPFEDEAACNNATIVLCEIYPRLFLMRAGHGTTKVKTLSGLNAVLATLQSKPMTAMTAMTGAENISDHDTDALVSAAGLRYLCGMDKKLPPTLSHPAAMSTAARNCEGWIFGVGDKKEFSQ